ncbi:Hypothetical protein NTJ_06180 [Nesidiocoris tenuis]|uniref:Uncharacterized protein n=1 Tax=Nesidiocoris tenuis TaxID=355587 RepID=A0ABN7AMA4_9HEMI|nr:Hypothetical protein NTJ_06180 [Nesidiocoris tenuis]
MEVIKPQQRHVLHLSQHDADPVYKTTPLLASAAPLGYNDIANERDGQLNRSNFVRGIVHRASHDSAKVLNMGVMDTERLHLE